MVLKKSILVLFIGLVSGAISRADVYVDNVLGRDQNSGKTEKEAVATFNRAESLLKAGERLVIQNTGKPYLGPLNILHVNATPAKPTLIEGNGAVISGLVALDSNKWTRREDGLFYYQMEKALPYFHPRLCCQKLTLTKVKSIDKLVDNSYCWTRDGYCMKLAGNASPAMLQLKTTSLCSGLQIRDSSYLQCRNLTCEYFANDGFNVHGDCRGLLFENIIGRHNGDDGFSVHTDVGVVVRNAWFHNNTYGIQDINASRSCYNGIVAENNSVGVHFCGGYHSLEDSIAANNTSYQVRLSSSRAVSYLGDARDGLFYRGMLFMKNCKLENGPIGLYVEEKCGTLVQNCLIRNCEAGCVIKKDADCEIRHTIIFNCKKFELTNASANCIGTANIIYPGKVQWLNKTVKEEALSTLDGFQTFVIKPEFKNSWQLDNQPVPSRKYPIGLNMPVLNSWHGMAE